MKNTVQFCSYRNLYKTIDPLGRPTVTDCSDHYFHKFSVFIRPSVHRHFSKSHKTKLISSENRRDYGSGREDHWWHTSLLVWFNSLSFISSWDEELAEVAQVWADQCANVLYLHSSDNYPKLFHERGLERITSKFMAPPGVGQNIAWALTRNLNFTRIIDDLWYRDINTLEPGFMENDFQHVRIKKSRANLLTHQAPTLAFVARFCFLFETTLALSRFLILEQTYVCTDGRDMWN